MADQRRDQAVRCIRDRLGFVGTVGGGAHDVGKRDHQSAVLIAGQREGIRVAHGATISAQLGRINIEVFAHLAQQTFANYYLEVLDSGP